MNDAQRFDQFWCDAKPATAAEIKFFEQFAQTIIEHAGRGKVLDVGCGEGHLVAALVSRAVDAQGIDLSSVAISRSAPELASRLKVGSAFQLPYANQSFSTVVAMHLLEHIAAGDLPAVLAELYRVTRRTLLLRVRTKATESHPPHPTAQLRQTWESLCFSAGFRKHPDYYWLNDYLSLQRDPDSILIPLEKIPEATLARYPLACLNEERGLHMDMLRESGSRSDAHVVRYHLAAQYIRPGDTVLDAACGLGYGSHLLARNTKAERVIGIDGSPFAIDYAQANFTDERQRTEFRVGFLPECLAAIADHSVHAVVSFETLEHVADPESLLAEFRRILVPGGRIIASVPNDWRDESGQDPNPHHLQVYDGQKFKAQIASQFDVEWLFAQSADRCKRLDMPLAWKPKPRTLERLSSVDSLDVEAEWWLAVASSPVDAGRAVPYHERYASAAEMKAAGNALAFGRDYENPWLLWSMVSIGARSECDAVMERWIAATKEVASAASADRGAALCVEAYRRIKQSTPELTTDLISEIERYLEIPPCNPNALRWHVSLQFVLGILALKRGAHDRAAHCFSEVLEIPAADYSPTLLTKTAEAAWHLGHLHLGRGDAVEAAHVWKSASAAIYTALGKFLLEHAGDPIPDFLPQELSLVSALTSRLVLASKYAPLAESSPRIFYKASQGDVLAHRDWLIGQVQHWQRVAEGLRSDVNQLHEERGALVDRLRALEVQQLDPVMGPPSQLALAREAKRRKSVRQIVIREIRRLVQQGKSLLHRQAS